eukprot:GFYU01007125.1.p1 GENE.GFYU01007125.1~~GFYU01007125.1.p1  ORF type:complete len:606 (-),score=181.88 GFYU01007125.1:336-2072(-)
MLKFCVRTKADKKVFTHRIDELVAWLFEIDAFQVECDDNKKECTRLLAELMTDCEENVYCIVQSEALTTRIMDYYVSLRPSERFELYNMRALPSLYHILRICAQSSQCFLQALVQHQNFDWAVKYLFLDVVELTPTADIIGQILAFVSKQIPSYNSAMLVKLLRDQRHQTLQANCIRFLETIVHTTEEKAKFVANDGLQFVTMLLCRNRNKYMGRDTISPVEETCLQLLVRGVGVLKVDQHASNYEKWTMKLDLLSVLIDYLSCPIGDVMRQYCYTLVRVLTSCDTMCKEQTLALLQMEHTPTGTGAGANGTEVNGEGTSALQAHHRSIRMHLATLDKAPDASSEASSSDDGSVGPVGKVVPQPVTNYYLFVLTILDICLKGHTANDTAIAVLVSVCNDTRAYEWLHTQALANLTPVMDTHLTKVVEVPALWTYVTNLMSTEMNLVLNDLVYFTIEKFIAALLKQVSVSNKRQLVDTVSDVVVSGIGDLNMVLEQAASGVAISSDVSCVTNLAQACRCLQLLVVNADACQYVEEQTELLQALEDCVKRGQESLKHTQHWDLLAHAVGVICKTSDMQTC